MRQRIALRHIVEAAFIASLVVLPVDDTFGAALSIVPTKLQLDGDRPTHSVTLTNNSEEAVTVQVETFAWTRTENFEDLEPTNELIAVPPFFDLGPGREQIVRVGLRSSAESIPQEKAFRLVLSEVPKSASETDLGVQFALRLSLPVFLTPAGATANPLFRTERDGDRLTLAMSNRGSQHYRVMSVKVSDAATGTAVATNNQPIYILAGQTRSLALRPSAPLRSDRVLIVAETSEGRIEVEGEIAN